MSDQQLLAVTYGRPGAEHPFQHVVRSRLSFEQTIEAVRGELLGNDLWIIHEIDPQMLLKRGGYAIGRTRQILFFHPRYMVRLLGADPLALPEAPLKAVVVEEGPDVTVRWFRPDVLFEKYRNDGLAELGREFAALYELIARRLTQ
ncbi:MULTISPECIES: DUF302 domain-containing protein [unclassified Mesorhizobium]|uniref:DUF302 domain-containing protein n=1 Tax=unclassified Mesorhizobium TaxID=325217 RepID=UPI00112E7EDE|nr:MULTISPECIES: DUF302 domain-containing protein [unclassified Mesorhizobium]TPJ76313.1 DUF302 domain-containing protein [Mesorhizobium sp. B2-6-2]TPO10753.1 DUF302 domain-containing protein [Mesorhizobium sp. B1-1-5]